MSHSLARTTRSKGRIQKPGDDALTQVEAVFSSSNLKKRKKERRKTHGSPASGARLSGIVWKCRDASQTVGSGDWLTFDRSLSGVTSGRCIEKLLFNETLGGRWGGDGDGGEENKIRVRLAAHSNRFTPGFFKFQLFPHRLRKTERRRWEEGAH